MVRFNPQDVILPINRKGKDAIVLMFLDACRYVQLKIQVLEA